MTKDSIQIGMSGFFIVIGILVILGRNIISSVTKEVHYKFFDKTGIPTHVLPILYLYAGILILVIGIAMLFQDNSF